LALDHYIRMVDDEPNRDITPVHRV